MSVRTAVALIAVGFVTACGSQVSPQAFYAAQLGTGAAGGASSAVNPSQSAAGGGAPSSSPGRGRSAPAVSAGAGSSAAAPLPGSSRSTSATGAAPRPTSSHASHAPASSSTPPAQCAAPTASTPTVVVCPSTGLHDGQSVHVYASGFQNAKPTAFTKALVVTECADKGNNTQQGDCGSLHFVNPDADGRVDLTITVVKVVGANKDVCGAKYKCLVSVAQPKQPPDYEADEHISFA